MFQVTTKKKHFLKRFNKSKKGFTLVEVLASIFVLTIVFMGVLCAVAFSRQMVFTNNNKEKASDQAQLVADEIITLVTGVADIDTAKDNVEEYYDTGAGVRTESDAGTEIVEVTTFAEPTSSTSPKIQYTITPAAPSTPADANRTDAAGNEYVETQQQGYNITVRVYYDKINGNGGYECVEINGFAASVYINT